MFIRAPINDSNCERHELQIENIDSIAQAIALILTSEYGAARRLATGQHAAPNEALSATEIEKIIASRLPEGENLYHRDGLLFQLMMWLSAHSSASSDIHSMPHTQPADKGRDSLILHLDDNGNLTSLSLCEDKATEKTREVIRDEIWIELSRYERNERNDELRSQIVSMLTISVPDIDDRIRIAKAIHWNTQRRYRIRVTTKEGIHTKGLFDGYPQTVTGDPSRRRGETIRIDNLRPWMSALRNRVVEELRGLEAMQMQGVESV